MRKGVCCQTTGTITGTGPTGNSSPHRAATARAALVRAALGSGSGAGTDTSGSGITVDDIMNGAHVLSTAAELAEIFGKVPEALGAWVEPIGGIITVIDMIINVIKALETEERGAGYRGTAYGTVYGALGMGTPSVTCSGSLQGHDRDELDQKAFDQGASESASLMSNAVNKNRVLVRIAVDGDPGTTVNKIYQQLCADSDDHQLAQAYENLSWPGPVCA